MLGALVSLALPVRAQDPGWPAKQIRIIAPGPAGSYSDNIARPIAEHLRKTLNQTVIVENKAGANSAIGAAEVARAAPDGHTLLITNTSSIAVNPQLYRKLSYSDRDFTPVTPIVQQAFVLAVNPEWAKTHGIQSVNDLIAWAKANPGKLRYASSGPGNLAHLIFAMLSNRTGIDTVHVPYKGFAPGQLGVMGGEVEAWFDLPSSSPVFESGKLKPLAVTSARRSERLPNVPTMSEAGQIGFEADFWMGFFVPAKTPSAVVAKVQEAIRGAAQDARVRAALTMQGDVVISDPEAFASRVQGDIAKWGAVIKRENLTLD
jgi:tripartite-type tricarboxylate transporter receptor subunit TctC